MNRSLDLRAAALAAGQAGCIARSQALRHGTHHRVRGAVVHQIDDLRPRHRLVVDGLSVTRPARAVVDIAATAGERYLAGLVDHLLVERHTTLAALAACFDDVVRPGKPGVAKLARVLDGRGPGYVPPHSEMERLLLEALDAAGLPAPERQMRLPWVADVAAFTDAGYRDARLVIEADGRRWHTKIADFARDRRRDAAAITAGWVTLRFSYEQVVGDPAGVAATVRDVRRVRLAQFGGDAGATPLAATG